MDAQPKGQGPALPMTKNLEPVAAKPLAILRQLAQPRQVQERCELCSIPLGPEHRHLLATANGQIVCACDPCALRFEAVIGGRFKLIPRNARLLADFEMTDAEWETLALPISLVFIFHSSRTNKLTAMYPSPAGATESLLPPENWLALIEKNPSLTVLESDVEALLVNRVGEARDYFVTPIDSCYELVGLIRKHWRGFAGGTAVWEQIDNFFLAAERAFQSRAEWNPGGSPCLSWISRSPASGRRNTDCRRCCISTADQRFTRNGGNPGVDLASTNSNPVAATPL